MSSLSKFDKRRPFPFSILPQNEEEKFMLEALKEAWKAFLANEVPIGAVIVHQTEKRIIARGYNQVEMLKDATAHAEMLCLTAAQNALDNWRLSETALYCTLEPCSMCAGALLLCRIPKLVWGAPDLRHGANGSWVDLFAIKHPIQPNVSIQSGVLKDASAALLRQFFAEKREQKDHAR